MIHILVVDDNEQNIYILEKILGAQGYMVDTAKNGSEALERGKQNPPDLIISDILMPVMDGFELCRQWKKDPSLASIPFVFYTATYTDQKDEEFALSLGADRFVIKPQLPAVILQLVKELLIGHESGRTHPPADESLVMKEYNEVLFRKLEKKVKELENEIENRKRTEEALQESNRKYSALYNCMMDAFVMVDMEGYLKEFNFAFSELVGYEFDELLTKTYMELTPERWHTFEQWIVDEQVLRRGYSEVYEKEYIKKDGTVIPVELRTYLFRDETGSPSRMWGIVRDISIRKHGESALRESDRKHRIVANNTYDWEFWEGIDGRYIYCSPSCFRITGHYASEFLKDPSIMDRIIHPEDKDHYIRHVIEEQDITRTGDIVFRIIHADGNVRWIGHTCQSIIGEDGQSMGVRGSNRDITDRKKAEQEILFQNIILSTQLQASIDGILVVDESGTIISHNRRFAEMWGISEKILSTGSNKNVTAAILELVDKKEQFLEKLRYLKDHQNEISHYEINLTDGRVFERYSSPMIGPDGKHYGRVWYFRDISERKRGDAELLRYRDHLEELVRERTSELNESEKNLISAKEEAEAANRAKTVFLSSMSHEIRTPLNAILGFSQLMVRDTTLPAQKREWLNIIIKSGEHLLDLINDILEISKIESGRAVLNVNLFDLRGFLDDLEKIFRYRVDEKHLSFIMQIDSGLPRYIETDGAKLRQIFINLAGNSVKFTDEGSITVRVRSEKGGAGTSRLIAEIEDTGPGISESEMRKLFSTFEQTELGIRKGGSGLGLAISRQFAKLMGGEIAVTSTQGRGCCFHFEIDFVEQSASGQKETIFGREIIGIEDEFRKIRILVVDDEPANRMLLAELLRSTGFTVDEASGAAEALDLYSAQPPDLIFLDVRIPGSNRSEAVKKLGSLKSVFHVPIIAVTASAFTENQVEILHLGVDEYIRKPFKINEIFDTLSVFLGVRYIYVNDDHAEEPDISADIECDEIAVLPEDLVARLCDAAQKLDQDCLMELIDEVEKHSEHCARVLRNLTCNYRYEEIILNIEKGKN